jgi:DNA-binding IclR family transcriptional regulator
MAVTDPARGVQTAMRAMAILEAFSAWKPALTLSEISEVVDLSPPTVHRLLKALRSRDLVFFDPESRRYSLGHGIMRMAKIVMERDDLANLAHPGMERLRAETSETVSLQQLMGDQRFSLVELTSPHPIRMASGVGTPYPLVRGSAGKAMLAALPQREIDRIVQTSTEPRKLAEELVLIRERGYAVSTGEVVAGASGLAAAVLDSTGAVAAAINVTGPTDRFTPERIHATAPLLLEVANNISRQLGGAAVIRPVAG